MKRGGKPRGGRKITIPDSRQALFEWFVYISKTQKSSAARKKMFKIQCKLFYGQWLTQKDEMIPGEKKCLLE